MENDQAVAAYRRWIQAYPKDDVAHSNLGSFYGDVCEYGRAITDFTEARRLNPFNVYPQEDLVEILTAVSEFGKAKDAYREMLSRNLDDDLPHLQMYSIAFLQRDPEEMANQAAWFNGKADFQHEILASRADAEAYSGHLARTRELTQQAVQSALRAGNKEQASGWQLNGAWREAMLGNTQEALDQTDRALSVAPDSREGAALAAILLARTGEVARAKDILSDLEKRYAQHFMMQAYWFRSIRAHIAMAKKDYAAALRQLQKTLPYDALIPQVTPYSPMLSVVLRAEAYSAIGQHAEAARQWEAVLKQPGIVQLSATAPIAKFELARTYCAQARMGDSFVREKAFVASQDFLSLWKDADPDIPVFKQAKAEFAKLECAEPQ